MTSALSSLINKTLQEGDPTAIAAIAELMQLMHQTQWLLHVLGHIEPEIVKKAEQAASACSKQEGTTPQYH